MGGWRRFDGLKSIANRTPGCVAAIGNFDGVHVGHQEVFSAGISRSIEMGLPCMVITFDIHPASRLRPREAPCVIMTLEDRLRIIAGLGVDEALVIPFDKNLASRSPEEFAREVLVKGLGAEQVVAGEGWRFGRDRSGDMDLLAELGSEMGFGVTKVPAYTYGGFPVSSTRIRGALNRGDVGLARNLLGRPHFIRGSVDRGEGRGLELGYPTVNLECGEVLLPSGGVYAAGFSCEGNIGPAAVNIGRRPTFGSGPTTFEAHLSGMEGDLYGKEITIFFLARLRDEHPFPDQETLKAQIGRDVERSKRSFSLSVIQGIPL
ncbi:MAG: riboflavin biosynthesis protein RibF [Deltaproteobacteria bacterium]|nr:riboflavin biosynthesis protein RibF [Deltaproteobacteria bacterium]